MTMVAGAESHSTDPVVGAELAANRRAGIALPWIATELAIINDAGRSGSCAAPLYVNLNSTVASTSNWYLQAGESQTWRVMVNRIGLMSTTTSTSAKARVGAWRY